MGCGSSSLKGDAPSGLNAPGGANDGNDPAPRPVKKVATNFSTVNYDNADGNGKRRHTEYAPHETERQPSAISEAVGIANEGVETKDPVAANKGEDKVLEPYHEPLSPGATEPKAQTGEGVLANGVNDPTTATAKESFAHENEPVAHSTTTAADKENVPNGEGLTPPTDPQRRESWFGKKYKALQDHKKGPGTREISDEDMKKYTGKGKDEMKDYVEGGEGVGGRAVVDYKTAAPGSSWLATGVSGGGA